MCIIFLKCVNILCNFLCYEILYASCHASPVWVPGFILGQVLIKSDSGLSGKMLKKDFHYVLALPKIEGRGCYGYCKLMISVDS